MFTSVRPPRSSPFCGVLCIFSASPGIFRAFRWRLCNVLTQKICRDLPPLTVRCNYLAPVAAFSVFFLKSHSDHAPLAIQGANFHVSAAKGMTLLPRPLFSFLLSLDFHVLFLIGFFDRFLIPFISLRPFTMLVRAEGPVFPRFPPRNVILSLPRGVSPMTFGRAVVGKGMVFRASSPFSVLC